MFIWKTVLILLSISVAVAQQKCWTTTGSTGSIVRGASNAVFSGTSIRVSGAVTSGSVEIRYNVVAVDGIFGGEGSAMTVRFRDNGVNARVLALLTELNLFTGQIRTIGLLNSNSYTPSSFYQTKSIVFACRRTVFDFKSKAYYIRVFLSKTGTGGNPSIAGINVCRRPVC